jgi:hypothetical protein
LASNQGGGFVLPLIFYPSEVENLRFSSFKFNSIAFAVYELCRTLVRRRLRKRQILRKTYSRGMLFRLRVALDVFCSKSLRIRILAFKIEKTELLFEATPFFIR